MERDFLFKTAIPLAVALAVAIGFTVWFHHFFETSTQRARTTFEAAMRDVAGRLGVRYHPPSEPNDWGGAGGIYRGHSIAVFYVSETNDPAKTGIHVHFANPISDRTSAALRAREKWFTLGKKTSDSELPAQIGTRLTSLEKKAGEVDLRSDGLLVKVHGSSTFFNYDMLTDVDRVVALLDEAIDVAVALESE